MTAAPPNGNRAALWLAALALSIAVLAAYLNSLSGALVFDDGPSISDNPTIRHLGTAWSPPSGQGITVDGRPFLNFSLALNYALGGTSVTGYHVVNLLIHLAAALTFFGLVRRTLLHARVGCDLASQQRTRGDRLDTQNVATRGRNLHGTHAGPYAPAALPLAFSAALLWALHPLQTESVTYIIQRAESLMGLCYLFTLYAFVRATEPSRATAVPIAASPIARRAWFAASITACLAGAATKEVTASAPLLVFLYDRTFVAGSFSAAWRQRRGYYLGLATTWVLLALLVFVTGSRGGTAGFGINVTPWAYALTQFQAICHYLWLSLWPSPLIFDYGTAWVHDAADVVPYALVVLTLLVGTLIALQRRPALGFLGLWFFCILAPTSSILPGNRQTLAEHRMYLPLAVLTVLAALGLYELLERRRAKASSASPTSSVASGSIAPRGYLTLAVCTAIALVFGVLTIRRNADYRTELGLYRDTVAKRPDNAFGRYNLGKALAESGAPAESIEQYEAALRLEPTWAHVHYNLGNALFDLRRFADAVTHFQAAIRLNPAYVRAHYNLGNALLALGQKETALDAYRKAVQLSPTFWDARDNLGGVLLDLGHPAEAIEQFEKVLGANPASAETHTNLGTALLVLNRLPEAIAHFEQALRLNPAFTPARDRLEQARRAAGH